MLDGCLNKQTESDAARLLSVMYLFIHLDSFGILVGAFRIPACSSKSLSNQCLAQIVGSSTEQAAGIHSALYSPALQPMLGTNRRQLYRASSWDPFCPLLTTRILKPDCLTTRKGGQAGRLRSHASSINSGSQLHPSPPPLPTPPNRLVGCHKTYRASIIAGVVCKVSTQTGSGNELTGIGGYKATSLALLGSKIEWNGVAPGLGKLGEALQCTASLAYKNPAHLLQAEKSRGRRTDLYRNK
jgi:hypothetical protein